MTTVSIFETWATIGTVAVTAVAGDILTAGAMRRIGDLDEIRAHSGLPQRSRWKCRARPTAEVQIVRIKRSRSSTLTKRVIVLPCASASRRRRLSVSSSR